MNDIVNCSPLAYRGRRRRQTEIVQERNESLMDHHHHRRRRAIRRDDDINLLILPPSDGKCLLSNLTFSIRSLVTSTPTEEPGESVITALKR